MTTNTKAAIAIVAGCLSGLVTMGLHPTGNEIAADVGGGGQALLNRFVHSLALLGQPLVLMGTLALTLRFTTHRALAVGAYILFAWASVAVMMATAASGFIATELIEARARETGAALDAINSALSYTFRVNGAFSNIFIVFSFLAILIWSVAMIRERMFSRALAFFGIISGTGFLVAILTGNLGHNIHSFGSVVLAQAIWLIWAAILLRRMPGS